ncbi:hypothetical protein Ancab_031934 [Ancistrocladus abbreviatus]
MARLGMKGVHFYQWVANPLHAIVSKALTAVVSTRVRKVSVQTTFIHGSSPLAFIVALVWKGFGDQRYQFVCLGSSSNQFAIGGVGSSSMRDISEGLKDYGLWWPSPPNFSVPPLRVSFLAGQGILPLVAICSVEALSGITEGAQLRQHEEDDRH